MPKTKYNNPPRHIRSSVRNYRDNTPIDSIPADVGDDRKSDTSVLRPYNPNAKYQRLMDDMAQDEYRRSIHPTAICSLKGCKGSKVFQAV